MELLPRDLFDLIVSCMSEASKAMFSITCKQLQVIPRKYSLLDSCVISDEYELVLLVESWGAEWANTTYRCLGASGSIRLLDAYLHKLQSDEYYELVAVGAAKAGKDEVLLFLKQGTCCKDPHAIWENIIDTLITSNNFHLLPICVSSSDSWISIANIAVNSNNKELFDFCCLQEEECKDSRFYLLPDVEMERLMSWSN